jgi:hypothetical protein
MRNVEWTAHPISTTAPSRIASAPQSADEILDKDQCDEDQLDEDPDKDLGKDIPEPLLSFLPKAAALP